MKTVEAYISGGNYSWVNLDKDIEVLHPENINFPHLKSDEKLAKLEEKFNKQKENFPNLHGYIDGKAAGILLFDNGQYLCSIWSARFKITGKYTKL